MGAGALGDTTRLVLSVWAKHGMEQVNTVKAIVAMRTGNTFRKAKLVR
jgi:hypothetical protein